MQRKRTPRKRTPLAERLWRKVDLRGPDECWPWTGACTTHGYGVINTGGRGPLVGTHRLSWVLANGPIAAGLEVCHSCDNPPCCNPAHLFLGTHRDNMRDAAAKRRMPGSRNNAKLSLDDADAIRAAWAAGGTTQRALAARYGVHNSAISRTVRGLRNVRR